MTDLQKGMIETLLGAVFWLIVVLDDEPARVSAF
jgi:hypothetical protein